MSTIPRVILANDLPGFGRVALAIQVPVLSSLGIQTCSLPTAILSTHGAYPGAILGETATTFSDTIAHWKTLHITFAAVATGFIASIGQFEQLLQLIADQRTQKSLILVDPVMGDNGKRYGICPETHVTLMRQLAGNADIITPNLTEAAILLGYDANTRPANLDELKNWLVALSQLGETGPRQVIITGIPLPSKNSESPEQLAIAIHDCNNNSMQILTHERLPRDYPGTGDLFSAVLLAALVKKNNLPQAVTAAQAFVDLAIRATLSSSSDPREGLQFESVLSQQIQIESLLSRSAVLPHDF